MNERMQQLVNELNAASEAYYGGSVETLTNYEWDAKFDELKALEDMLGVVLEDSPTKHVSHEVITGIKEEHEYPALSLPKSKSVEAVLKWANGKAVDLSWKLDGMTLVVTWNKGKLVKVVTRGDGIIGSNITHLVDAIENIPKEISYKGRLVVRGEALISYEDFAIINAECDNTYENPRNLVAGSLNPLTTVDNIMNRHIMWIPFTLVHLDEVIVSWRERMLFLTTLGLKVVSYEYMANSDDLEDVIFRWSDMVEMFAYPVDGLVVVYDDTEYAAQGTLTGHHDTRGGYAFKWADEEAVTKLLSIEWSVSMQSINPVAIFEPVRLEGTTVKRASLCNISECERLGIGGVGTELTVIKANKIIPKVIKASGENAFVVPDKCPICGHATNVKISSSGAKVLTCTNDECVAKNIRKMSRFVAKHGFNINGLSSQKLIDLVNKGLISDVYDILTLPTRTDAVKAILSEEDGWGEKSINNLLDSVFCARAIKTENLLYSLCIPMCGRDISKKLSKKYTLSQIVEMAKIDAMNNTTSIFDGVDGVGDVKATSFINWFKDNANVKMLLNMIELCSVTDVNVKQSVSSDSKVAGLTFVITGSLNHYASRDVLKDWIEAHNGKVSGSVSAKTNYLINNDVESSSSKNKKAKDLGVEIISEETFLQMFGE